MWKKKIGKYRIIKPLEERDKKGAFGDVYLVEYNDKQEEEISVNGEAYENYLFRH